MFAYFVVVGGPDMTSSTWRATLLLILLIGFPQLVSSLNVGE